VDVANYIRLLSLGRGRWYCRGSSLATTYESEFILKSETGNLLDLKEIKKQKSI